MVVKSWPNDVILWTLKGPSWGGWIGSLQPLDTEQVVSLSFTSTQHSVRYPCALRCYCWWSLSNIQQASSTLCSRKQLQKQVSHPWQKFHRGKFTLWKLMFGIFFTNSRETKSGTQRTNGHSWNDAEQIPREANL